jgi:hypothetical protein
VTVEIDAKLITLLAEVDPKEAALKSEKQLTSAARGAPTQSPYCQKDSLLIRRFPRLSYRQITLLFKLAL